MATKTTSAARTKAGKLPADTTSAAASKAGRLSPYSREIKRVERGGDVGVSALALPKPTGEENAAVELPKAASANEARNEFSSFVNTQKFIKNAADRYTAQTHDTVREPNSYGAYMLGDSRIVDTGRIPAGNPQAGINRAQREIDEIKYSGKGYWDPGTNNLLNSLGRGLNRAAQGYVQSMGNLGQGIGKTLGMDDYAADVKATQDRWTSALQNTEFGRQNAALAEAAAQRNAYADQLKAATARDLARQAMNSGDFSSGSKYNPNLGNDKDYDINYETVNNSRRYQTQLLGEMINGGNKVNRNYAQLTPEETAVYNYYYNKGDKETAQAYLDSLYSDLEKRRYESDTAKIQEYATENPVAASIASPLIGSVSGVTAIPGIVDQMKTGRVNPYASYNSVSQLSQTARSTVADNIANSGVKGAGTWSWLYQTGESILENAARNAALGGMGAAVGQGLGLTANGVRAVAGNMSLIPMALGVYQNTANEAKLKGRTDEEATALGIVAAGAEYLTENISFDKLFDAYVSAKHGTGDAFRRWVSQMATEGMEEGASNIINNIADILILGDRSEWSEAVRKYQAEGETEENARKKAFLEKAGEFGLDVLGGVISGGAMVGPALALDASVRGAAERQNRVSEQTKSQVENARQQAEAAQTEAKEGANLSSEEWEASRKDQSDAAKKRRAALRASAAAHGVDEETIRTMEAVSDTTGRNYIWYTNPATEYGVDDGYYDEKTGDVHINTESKQPLSFVIGHELTHSTEGSAAYSTLREFALRHLREAGVDVDALRQRRTREYERFGAKNVDIDGEIVADYAGRVLLQDASEIENFVNARHDVAQRVWNWINDRLTRIAGDGALREQAMLTRAQELYGRALAQARPAEENAPAQVPAQNTDQRLQPQTAGASAQAQTQRAQVTPDMGVPTAEMRMAEPENVGDLEGYDAEAADLRNQYRADIEELHRQRQNGEISEEVFNQRYEARDRQFDGEMDALDEEYGRTAGDEYHQTMQEVGAENENGEREYSITPRDEKEVYDYIDSLPEKTKFSISTPVEKTKDLIAVHNVDIRGLESTLELGAFPAPSIAIIRDSMGHDMYGEYSVLFGRDTIDPKKNKKNNIFGGDAWTPTHGNAMIESEVNQDVLRRIDKDIDNLSRQLADGLFHHSSVLGSMGIHDATDMTIDEIAERMSQRDEVRAAYLADKGETLKPVKREKKWNRKYGNEYLQKFIQRVTPQRLAQIASDLYAGKNVNDALGEEYDTIRSIIREYYYNVNERMLQAMAQKRGWSQDEINEARERRADKSMELNVSPFIIEEFAEDAWSYYEDSGRTKSENDLIATEEELRRRTNDNDVKAWVKDKLSDLLGKKGIRNNSDIFTPSGDRRSFKQTHWEVTAENIVKAMASAGDKGVGTFSTGSVRINALPRYNDLDEVRADKKRLKLASEEEYSNIIKNIENGIKSVIQDITAYNNNSGYSYYSTVEDVMAEAAVKSHTIPAIKKTFANNNINISNELAQEVLDIFNEAASVPTGYFEAKPMRTVGFDEVGTVLAPDNAPDELMSKLADNGFDVEYYKSGDTDDRSRVLNDAAENHGLKFSFSVRNTITPAENAEYMKAAEAGDEETAGRMVEEAANNWAGGEAIRVYHGSEYDGNIEVFITPNYSTTRKDVAETYASEGKKDNVYGLYFNPTGCLVVEGNGESNRSITVPDELKQWFDDIYGKKNHKASTDEIVEIAQKYKYNGVIFKNIKDIGRHNWEWVTDEHGWNQAVTPKGGTDVFVAFSPNQIKSADPITYDSDGNIIPLSERFNREKNDIRYSVTPNEMSLDSGEESEYNSLASDGRVVWGDEGKTYTDGRNGVTFRYAVVPADTLVMSNDEYGNVNPDYPAELQPRDRTRAASQGQITRMANTLNPELLAESATAQNGAPIIRGDGVVVGGNGRSAAIAAAYANGSGDEYRQFIEDNAAKFGIEGDLPEDPVLVRVADGEDWTKLAASLNQSSTATYSSTEQAQTDAERMGGDLLAMLNYDVDRGLNIPDNLGFISEFIRSVAGDSEKGSLVTADGYLSQEGLRRVENAVFAKAYGDTDLLVRLSESLDNDMKNVTKALMSVAGHAVSQRYAAEQGAAYDVDVTNEILSAIDLIEEAKESGTDIGTIAGQTSLDGQKYGDGAAAIAKYINLNKRSGAKIREFVDAIYTAVDDLGDPGQIGMDLFEDSTGGNENVRANEIIRRAARRILDEAGYDLTGRPNVDLGFEIEDIGESESLPRNTRQSQSEPVSRNAGDSERDEEIDTGRREGAARAPERGRSGRVVLPEPGDGRYIDRESTDFADVIRQEAAKLGMVEPPEGGQLELAGDREHRQTIDSTAQATRDWIQRQRESIAADRTIAEAQTEQNRKLILSKANEQAEARRELGNKDAEKIRAEAQEAADARRGLADKYAEQKTAEANEREAVEREQAAIAAENLTKARQQARADAEARRKNADIQPPTTSDTAGQKAMFQAQYDSRHKYNRAKALAGLSETDWDRVSDLMAGRLSAEYDIGDAEDPDGVQRVFNALLEYDKASRTVEAYRKQKNEELRSTADEKLQNVSQFKDKSIGARYATETQIRNIRDIAPAADAEAINQEYFYPIKHHTRQANDLMRSYNDRVRALGISNRTKSGNKVSEAYAVQFVGEMRSILDQLGKTSERFNKSIDRKMEIYDSGKGTNGLSRDEANAMKSMTREQFLDYLNSKAPNVHGMTYDQAAQYLDDFMRDNPNFDYSEGGELNQKIAGMQKIYSELLEKMNEVYIRWGYEPMGDIKGYFPHFINDSDTLLQKIGKRLGIDQASFRLPTEIIGETADRKPGVRWFANKLSRRTNVTDYDALEGFAKYIRGAADVIYHTEDIQKLRQFVNQIRYLSSDKAIQERAKAIENNPTLDADQKNIQLAALYEDARFALGNYVQDVTEYTNILANKRSELDRGMEKLLGRNRLYRAFNTYNSLRSMAAVAGNITSAMTNLIPAAQVTGIAGVGNTTKAFLDTIANMFTRNGGDNLRLRSDFLVNREQVNPVNMTTGEKVIEGIGWLFEHIDRLGSETVWRACYYNNLHQGMSENAAAELADHQAAGVVADRSKGGMPTIFHSKNPLVKIGTRFMLEQNNTIRYYLKDIPRERRRQAKSVLLGEAVALFFTWLFNEGFQYLFGRRPAQEPSELVNDIVGDITGYRMKNTYSLAETSIKEGRLPTADDFKVKKGDIVKDTISDTVDMLPFTGWADLVNQIAGLDLDIQGGRFPVGDVFPEIPRLDNMTKAAINGDPWDNQAQVLAEELTKPLVGLAPLGNQAQKTAKGIATMIAGGSYKINSKGEKLLQYPVEQTPGNWARAAVAGKSALPTAQEWVENGFDTLSAKDTEIYDMATGYGVKPKDALNLIKELNKIQKTDDESKAQLQRKALIDSDIDQTAKLMLYYGKFAGDNEKALIDEIGGDNGNALLKAIDGCKNSSTNEGDRQVLLNSGLNDRDRLTMYTDYVLNKNSAERAMIQDIRYGEDAGELLRTLSNVKDESKTLGKTGALVNSSLSETAKEAIYKTLCVQSDDLPSKEAKIEAFKEAGMGFDEYITAANKYAEINAQEDLKPTQKATEFARWADTNLGSGSSTAKENLKYSSGFSVEASGYEKMTDTGLSSDKAYDLTNQIAALEPKEGKTSVSDVQKAQVVASQADLSEEEKLKALRAVYSESENSTYSKAYVANMYGVPLEDYFKIVDKCLEVDADPKYKDYKAQERTAAVLNSFKNLTNKQRAAIWQVYNTGWVAKNNPYDSSVGAYVRSLYYEADGKTKKETLPGGLSRSGSSSASAELTPPKATASSSSSTQASTSTPAKSSSGSSGGGIASGLMAALAPPRG